MFTYWDKNDPKDTQVLLELLKQGVTMRYVDPLIAGWHDIQEVSKTYWQVTLARTRVQHSLLTHFLPLYWPEFARFWRTSRSEAFCQMLHAFPTPASITATDCDTFIKAAASPARRKVNKRAWLTEIYERACRSIALPTPVESPAVATFRLRLESFLTLSAERMRLERWAAELLSHNGHYQLLQTIPGIGPVFALTILAEAGDLRRFAHHRQFLKFCGLDLAKSQSGMTRGREQLSKRGCAPPLRILVRQSYRSAPSRKQHSRQVRALHRRQSQERRSAAQSLHRHRREDGKDRLCRNQDRTSVSQLLRVRPLRWVDPSQWGR